MDVDIFEDSYFGETNLVGSAPSPDDIFGILEAFETASPDFTPTALLDETTLQASKDGEANGKTLVSQKSTSSNALQEYSENEVEAVATSKRKRQKISSELEGNNNRVPHITVERNRRKQMNDNLTVLRSLMPCFYVKRGDQASIIGGVVDYINELQQVLQTLEAKKQRKLVYNDALSPRFIPSPRVTSPLSPRKPPLSPRLSFPISPRTPLPSSPYNNKLWLQHHQSGFPSPCSSSASSSIDMSLNELFANSKSAIADVEVKFSGANVLVKTVSPRIPGQAVKIIATLEELSLEILNVNLSTIDETMHNSFTIKIGIECQLSAEELANQIQQTFSMSRP